MHELNAHFVPFTAQTRMSGVDVAGTSIRKGAVDAILSHVDMPQTAVAAGAAVQALRPANSAETVREIQAIADEIAKSGGTPLAVARDGRLLGRHPSEGHRQGRHPRALRRAAPHGHPHRDDHRRQSA